MKLISKVLLFTSLLIFSACASKHHKSISNKGKELNSNPSNNISSVAFLVPLSGKGSDIGKALTDAANLALKASCPSHFNLVTIDTGLGAQNTRKSTVNAITKNARLILGPLFSDDIKYISDVSIKNGINIVTFSNNKLAAKDNVYLMGFLPDQQIRKIVKYTIDNKDITEFLTLVPNNKYGNEISETLRDTANNLNASVVKIEYYNENMAEIDFAAKTIANYVNEHSNDRLALLIPEGGNKLRKIITTLKKNNINFNNIQILGSGQWDDQAITNIKELENALFATSITHDRKLFERIFAENYGYSPTRISTLAYDAVSLACYLDNNNDYSKVALTSKDGFTGVDGAFRFKENGLSERNLSVVEIKNGQLNIIDKAEPSFN